MTSPPRCKFPILPRYVTLNGKIVTLNGKIVTLNLFQSLFLSVTLNGKIVTLNLFQSLCVVAVSVTCARTSFHSRHLRHLLRK